MKYALTFVAKDRPGIVAEVTKVLFEKGFNIADSSSTRLQGIFSMILLVEHANTMDKVEISSFFKSNDLKPSVHEIEASPKDENDKEHYVISVYGADKPGIVHNITASLYEKGINILDLQTQVAGAPPKEAYIMILEVIVPDALGQGWIEPLKEKAAAIGTDITIRSLDVYEL